MSLQVVGLQCGPCLVGESSQDRLAALATAFEQALRGHPRARLLVFPELMGHPYFCLNKDDAAFARAEPLEGPTVSRFAELAKQHEVAVIATLFERQSDISGQTRYFNTAVLIDASGSVAGVYRKTHIPTLKLVTLPTDESYYFSAGSDLPVFEIEGVRVGILICFDRSFPEAARTLARQGADLIVIPAASSGGERATRWVSECVARAMENGVHVLGVNRAGTETLPSGEKIEYFGFSCACLPTGEVARVLNGAEWATLGYEVDPQACRQAREALPLMNLLRDDLYGPWSTALERVRTCAVSPIAAPSFGPRLPHFCEESSDA